jgi:hypothetical protein
MDCLDFDINELDWTLRVYVLYIHIHGYVFSLNYPVTNSSVSYS